MKKENKEFLKYLLKIWNFIIKFLLIIFILVILSIFIAKLLQKIPSWIALLLLICFIVLIITLFIYNEYKKNKTLKQLHNKDNLKTSDEEIFKINDCFNLKKSLNNYYYKKYKIIPFEKVYAEINKVPVYLTEVQVRYIQYLCHTTNNFEKFKKHFVIYSGPNKKNSYKMIFKKSGVFENKFKEGFIYNINNDLIFKLF